MKEREPNRKTLLEAKNIVKVFGAGPYQVKPLKGVNLKLYAGEFVRFIFEAQHRGITAARGMNDEIIANARPGKDVFRPAETEVREMFQRDRPRINLAAAKQPTSRVGSFCVEQKGKGSGCGQQRVDVEIDSARDETCRQCAADFNAKQTQGGTNQVARQQ